VLRDGEISPFGSIRAQTAQASEALPDDGVEAPGVLRDVLGMVFEAGVSASDSSILETGQSARDPIPIVLPLS
jgi:hypothetical protein